MSSSPEYFLHDLTVDDLHDNEDDSVSGSEILDMMKATEESNKEFSEIEQIFQAPSEDAMHSEESGRKEALFQDDTPPKLQQEENIDKEKKEDREEKEEKEELIQQQEPSQDDNAQLHEPLQQQESYESLELQAEDDHMSVQEGPETVQLNSSHEKSEFTQQIVDTKIQVDSGDENDHENGLVEDEELFKHSPQHDIFETLYETPTVANTSFLRPTGETRREEVARLRMEKKNREEEALTFKPKINPNSAKKCSRASSLEDYPQRKDVYVDKELTFTPKISEKGRQFGSDRSRRSSKEKAEELYSSPGAGRSRDYASNTSGSSESFTPEITKMAKKLNTDKAKVGSRLYNSSKSRELERQPSGRTYEDTECTFKPVFESKAKFVSVKSKNKGNDMFSTPTGSPSKTTPSKSNTKNSPLKTEAGISPSKSGKMSSPSKSGMSSPSKSGMMSSPSKSGMNSPFKTGVSPAQSGVGSPSDDFTAEPAKTVYTLCRRVLVVGSSNMDLISYVHEHPPIGATITGVSFEKKYGGKGANQAVMVARLCRPFVNPSRRTSSAPSTSVAFLTKLGVDIYGQDYFSYLRGEEGLATSEGLLRSHDSATGVALITVDRVGRNTIILQPGANLALQPDEVTTFIANQAKFSNVLVCQNEISHGATLQALAEASSIDHMVSIFNPAPISPNLENMFELLRYADVICPNEVELSLLAAMPVRNEKEAVKAGRVVLEKCRNLRKLVHFMTRERSASEDVVDGLVHIPEEDTGAVARRPQVLVVTLGSLGACIVSDSGSEMIRAPVVKAVDTVGAGDCFIGTLAYHISNAVNLKQSVEYAVECASISVTRKGAQTSYPLRSELNYDYCVSSSSDPDALETLDINQ